MSSKSPSDSFKGFHNEEISPTLAVLVSLGSAGLLCQALPLPLAGLLSVGLLMLTYKWFHLHGLKLTRKGIIFFDEGNLLQNSHLYDFAFVVSDDCSTPGAADYKPPGPSSIWEALFTDEKQLDLQKFYREHYGPIFRTAMKNTREREEIKKQRTGEDSTRTARNLSDR